MTTRWARFGRGWTAAVFSTFVAALSHTVGGGSGPGLLPLVLSLAFAGILCIGLAGRTLSLWRVSLSVLASQLIFHGLFSLGGSGGALGVAAGSPHDHQGTAAQVTTAVLPGAMSGTMSGTTAGGVGMWLAHLGAAGVTIAALRVGERAFWGLLENARLAIRALFAHHALAFPPHAPRRIVTTAPVVTPRDPAVLFSPMRHRGPPTVPLPA